MTAGERSHWVSEAGWKRWGRVRNWVIGMGALVALPSWRWLANGTELHRLPPLLFLPAFLLLIIATLGWGATAGFFCWSLCGIGLFGSRDAGWHHRIGCGLAAAAIAGAAIWRVAELVAR